MTKPRRQRLDGLALRLGQSCLAALFRPGEVEDGHEEERVAITHDDVSDLIAIPQRACLFRGTAENAGEAERGASSAKKTHFAEERRLPRLGEAKNQGVRGKG